MDQFRYIKIHTLLWGVREWNKGINLEVQPWTFFNPSFVPLSIVVRDEFKYIKIGLLSYYFQLSEWNYPRNKGMPFKAVNNGLITFPLLRLPMLRKRRYWSWPLACNKQFFTYLLKKNLLISKMSGKSKCNIV